MTKTQIEFEQSKKLYQKYISLICSGHMFVLPDDYSEDEAFWNRLFASFERTYDRKPKEILVHAVTYAGLRVGEVENKKYFRTNTIKQILKTGVFGKFRESNIKVYVVSQMGTRQVAIN